MTNLSLQLYTLRDQLAADTEATVRAIAEMGLTEVEPFGIHQAGDLPQLLSAYGLNATSAHGFATGAMTIRGNEIPDVSDATLDAAVALGVKTLFQPVSDPGLWADQAAVDALAEQVNQAAHKAADRGLRFGYHNHDWEFSAQFDGVNSYDYFVSKLDPSVLLEIDTFWAAFGGQDVNALLARLGDRVTHLHVKDGELKGERKPNVVLGQGDMPLDDILSAHTDKTWVVEFDSCATDVVQAVADSVAYLKGRI